MQKICLNGVEIKSEKQNGLKRAQTFTSGCIEAFHLKLFIYLFNFLSETLYKKNLKTFQTS